MTVDAPPAAPAPARSGPPGTGADGAIARRAFRQIRVGAIVCALGFGAMVASTAISYANSYPTDAARQQVAETMRGDSGLAVLLGPIGSVDSVGGYTVYKLFVTLTTIGAIWGLLMATRLLRGEEDAGRWQLVLAGSTTAARATTATLAALATAAVVVFAGTSAIGLLAARDPDLGLGAGPTLLYGLSITLPIAVFGAVGALTSQLGRTRRMATGLGMTAFGAAFVVRMIADSGPDTHWLQWATPFGWSELMQPFTRNDLRPLVPAALTVAVLALAATRLAARRDAGDGLLASRDVSRLRPFGLDSPLGLAVRLELPVLLAWISGAAATGLFLGIVATLTTATVPESVSDTLRKFGVHGSFPTQYFGVAFLMVATLVALIPASQVGAAAEEERSGRLVQVLSRPPTRARWLGGRLALTGAAVVAAAVVSGLATWVGAVSQGIPTGLGTMLAAGLNVVPTALVALGFGAVLLSVAPRFAAGAVYAVIIWSVSVDLVSSMLGGFGWLAHLSLYHYMALAPAQDLQPTTLALTTAAGLGLCLVATILFDRRDLRTGT